MKNAIILSLVASLALLITPANASTTNKVALVKAPTASLYPKATESVKETVHTKSLLFLGHPSTNYTYSTNVVVQVVTKANVHSWSLFHLWSKTTTLDGQVAGATIVNGAVKQGWFYRLYSDTVLFVVFIVLAFVAFLLAVLLYKERAKIIGCIVLDIAEAKPLYISLIAQAKGLGIAAVKDFAPEVTTIEAKLKVAEVDLEKWGKEALQYVESVFGKKATTPTPAPTTIAVQPPSTTLTK